MSNEEVLEFLEQNIEAVVKIQYFMETCEELTCGDLMSDIETDHFEGYECMLPVMLMSSGDGAIVRTRQRLFLQLFREKMRQVGARQMAELVAGVLAGEQARFARRHGRIRAPHDKDGL